MPLILLVLEILIFIGLIDNFGFINSMLIYLIPTIVGFFIFKNFNRTLIMDIQTKSNPSRELIKQGLTFIAAILLILPSFITKVIGVFLILPFVRSILVWGVQGLVLKKVFSRAQNFTQFGGGNFRFYYQNRSPRTDSRDSMEDPHSSNVYEAQYRKIEETNLIDLPEKKP